MSEQKKFVMTYEGVKKLEEELEYLKRNYRKNKGSIRIRRLKWKLRIRWSKERASFHRRKNHSIRKHA